MSWAHHETLWIQGAGVTSAMVCPPDNRAFPGWDVVYLCGNNQGALNSWPGSRFTPFQACCAEPIGLHRSLPSHGCLKGGA